MNVTLTRPILQVNEYYPFGMEMAERGERKEMIRWIILGSSQIAGYSYENVLEPENKYKYNGKELQDDLDLDW